MVCLQDLGFSEETQDIARGEGGKGEGKSEGEKKGSQRRAYIVSVVTSEVFSSYFTVSINTWYITVAKSYRTTQFLPYFLLKSLPSQIL